uniref:tRNA 2-thiouridine synthesizing protein E n=1 Tax=Candidatus Kentrum sp. FW TaxID=2126338 RepID=A0A450U2Q7_9GAMM|nr:MAG: tRNA 2-thiouridine synthesizing protein E [Candidatus Kentron sp. FW]
MTESMQDIMHPGANSGSDPDFPHAPEGWTRSDAERIAKEEGITLTDEHWGVIHDMQEFYDKHPEPHIHVRELNDALEEKYHINGGIKHLYQLFSGGPTVQGCRIAGLKLPIEGEDHS